MTIHQVSVFVENRKGALGATTRILADAGINLRALLVADTPNYGILRIIVNDTQKAVDALKNGGHIASVTEVLAVETPDAPGGLSALLQILCDADVNVEYVYAFIGSAGKQANVVLRVDDNARAEAVLRAAGIRILGEEDIAAL